MEIPVEFKYIGRWFDALDEPERVAASPAVYMIALERPFPRFRGTSRILYVGSTRRIGGQTSTCRLRTYRNPGNGHGKYIGRVLRFLMAERADAVPLLYMCVKPDANAARRSERRLLRQYKYEHLELPPLNRRTG